MFFAPLTEFVVEGFSLLLEDESESRYLIQFPELFNRRRGEPQEAPRSRR